MTMIRIKKIDNVHFQVITDNKQYIADLKEHFTSYVDGYKHMQKYKAGGWDGRICLVAANQSLPYGLLFQTIKFHRLYYNNIELKVDNDVKEFFNGKEVEIDNILNKTPRSYQLDCIESALKYKRCIMRVATSGGKSLIISYIIKTLLDNDDIQKALIIVPTQSLVIQFFSDMIDYGIDEKLIGRYYSKIKEIDRPIVISTWQSLSKRPELIEDFQCFVCDECHSIKGLVLRKLLSQSPAEWRFGLTGTLPNSKLDTWQIMGYIGPVVRTYGSNELAEQGYISRCNIQVMNLMYDHEYDGDYDTVKTDVFNNPNRLSFIHNELKKIDDNILILVGKVEKEGQLLKDYLEKRKLDGKEIVFLWGDTKVEEREKWRNEFENRKNIILIATYGIMSVGINIPSLKYVMFASPFKSKIRILQSIGRSLRLHENKQHATIFDLADDVLYLNDHSMRRKHYYKTESFDITETVHQM